MYNIKIKEEDYKDIYPMIDDDGEAEAIWMDIDDFKNRKKILYPEEIFKYYCIMYKMNALEAQEAFKMLEKAGMNPQWCNTPVPYFDASVQAGVPTDPGDIPFGEQLMMAEDMVKGGLTFCINVRGYSMKDANIVDGDRVELLTGVPVRDGDIVIAEIDKDEYTLKSYCMDEQGNKWLVPANTAFKPILLTEEMEVRFLGKVVRVVKDAPRVPYAELMKWVKEMIF